MKILKIQIKFFILLFIFLISTLGVKANIYNKKFDLSLESGANPYGSLTSLNNEFYGMTSFGGLYDYGVILKWNPTTNVYNKKFDFQNNTGIEPYGSMVLKNLKFYGMTSRGGLNNCGTIFEWDPSSNVFTKKFDFNNNFGTYPRGFLILFQEKFYGMTYRGGLNNKGTIFEWDPSSNIFTKKFDFDGIENGNYPYGSLTIFNNKFYGMTSEGGKYDQGVLFEWDPVLNTFNKKIDFNYLWNGSYPYGTLSVNGSKLYGITTGGGSNNWGVIFEWDPLNDIYTKKINLDTGGGNYFNGKMSLFDGKFYGMMYQGGINHKGTIFEWNQNSPPVAQSLSVTGSSYVGSTLVGNYTYFDEDGDIEGESIYKWYRDDVGIDNSSSKTYITKIEDIGKLIKFEVTPVAITGEKIGNPFNVIFPEVIKKAYKLFPAEFTWR